MSPTITARHDSLLGRSQSLLNRLLQVTILGALLEYAVHAVAARRGAEQLLVHYGRFDSVADLGFDRMGAGLVIVFGETAPSNLVESGPDTPSTEGEP